MLKESVSYHKNYPFSIEFSNVIDENPHYHDEMEVILVLKGNMKYKMNHLDYSLTAGDILIADPGDLHRIYDADEDSLTLMMHVYLPYFNESYPNIDFMIFACQDIKESTSEKTTVLKQEIAQIMDSCKNDNPDTMEKVNDFIYTLVNHFQGFYIRNKRFITAVRNVKDLDLKRIYEILKYIYENYSQKITLDDLASLEHLSPYYISHLIKDTTGLSFQNLLNYTRVEYAEKFLLNDNLSLTQISGFCGFSSLAYFNKCFKEWYDISPAQYRKKHRQDERIYGDPINEREAEKLLLEFQGEKGSNVDLNQLPKHLLVPIKNTYSQGRNFKKHFAFKLYVTPKELKKQLEDINFIMKGMPENLELVVGNQLPAIINDNLAQGLVSFFQSRKMELSLGSCINHRGILTPTFYMANLFKSVSGSVVALKDEYLMVHDKHRLFLFIANTHKNNLLKVHVRATDNGIYKAYQHPRMKALSTISSDENKELYLEVEPEEITLIEIQV